MKIPKYITQEQIKRTQNYATTFKRKEGIDAYLFFKRLSILAMYVGVISSYISYSDFLYSIQTQIIEKNKSIFQLWEFANSHNPNGTKTHVYGVDLKFLNQSTPENEYEKEILRFLRRKMPDQICRSGEFISLYEELQDKLRNLNIPITQLHIYPPLG